MTYTCGEVISRATHVQPLAGTVTEKPVHAGIHAEGLITAFLVQRALDASQAASYLRETIFQPSPFAPVHYFFQASGLGADQVRASFKDAGGAAPATHRILVASLAAIGLNP